MQYSALKLHGENCSRSEVSYDWRLTASINEEFGSAKSAFFELLRGCSGGTLTNCASQCCARILSQSQPESVTRQF